MNKAGRDLYFDQKELMLITNSDKVDFTQKTTTGLKTETKLKWLPIDSVNGLKMSTRVSY